MVLPRDPRIAVQIAAVDQFSATLAKFKKEIAGAGAAAGVTNGRLGKIALPDVGIGPARDALTDFHRQAQAQLGNIGRLVPGLGALGAAATIAGVGEMVDRYATMGAALGRVSTVAGTTAAGMDSLRGATRLLGVSSDTADQAMVGLNKTLADAFYGKNAEAAAMFQQMGVGLTAAGGAAKKAEQVLPRIADFIHDIARVDPRAAVTALERLGISPDMLPLLMRGADGMAQLRAEAARLAGITGEGQAASERYTEAMGRMGIATDRVGRSIMTSLEPHLTPVLTSLSEYIDRHADDIGASFDHIARGIEHMDWKSVGDGITKATGYLDDWSKMAARASHSFDWLDDVMKKIKEAGHFVGADKIFTRDLTPNLPADTFQQDVFDQLDGPGKYAYQNNPNSREAFNRTVHPERYNGGTPRGPSTNMPIRPPMLGPSGSNEAVQANPGPEDAAYKPVLDLLGRAEGTDRGRGYNESLGYGKWTGGNVDLTKMTLNQIDALQQSMLDKQHAEGIGDNASSALGRYQFTQTTLRDMRNRYKLTGDETFDERMQDHLAVQRIKMNGRMTQDSVAQIWASLPGAGTGQSVYGQHTGATSAEVQDALAAVDARQRAERLPQLLAPPNPAFAPAAGAQPRMQIDFNMTADGIPDWMNVATRAAADGVDMGAIRVRRAMPTGTPDRRDR